MEKKLLIFICCLCLMGCKKNQVQTNKGKTISSNVSDTVGAQNKTENSTVKKFNDSLNEEKYINAYKDLVLFLWDKNGFIEKNYDTIDKRIKFYKSNEIVGAGTRFVNNELLTNSPVKIGMDKNDVYELLGTPERLIVNGNKETIDYSYFMYVPNHNKAEEKFYADTGVEIFFDENKKITKVFLLVEKIQDHLTNSEKNQPYDFKNNTEYENFLNTNWKEAEKLFDSKKYQEAIKKYQEVTNAFEYHNNDIIHVSENEKIDSKIKQYEKFYFSLYNISCCHSLLENFDKTKEFLHLAIIAGYPYLEYILNDKDLEKYFEKDPNAKKNIVDVYNAGNSNSIIAGKILSSSRGPGSGSEYFFSSDSNSVIRKRYTDSFNKDTYYAHYYVKNYFIICHFYKNTFLDNKGFIVGIGIKEEECEKIEKEINYTNIIPFSLIGNVKTYFDWPCLDYKFY